MKLPIAHTLGNRQVTLDRDPLMRNALAEPDEQYGIVRARKRPAIESAFSSTAGRGQGLFTWTTPNNPGGTLVVISDDTLVYGNSLTTLPKLLSFTVEPS